jgi:hypothetical protein
MNFDHHRKQSLLLFKIVIQSNRYKGYKRFTTSSLTSSWITRRNLSHFLFFHLLWSISIILLNQWCILLEIFDVKSTNSCLYNSFKMKLIEISLVKNKTIYLVLKVINIPFGLKPFFYFTHLIIEIMMFNSFKTYDHQCSYLPMSFLLVLPVKKILDFLLYFNLLLELPKHRYLHHRHVLLFFFTP